MIEYNKVIYISNCIYIYIEYNKLKMAMPSLSLYPSDSIKPAAKDTVATSAATSK